MMDKPRARGNRQAARNEYAKPKKRGRPLTEKGDTTADVIQLGRARTRRAQRAFRQRKEQHVNDLQERVSDLENVVEEMANTFLGFSDGLLESGQVNPKLLKLAVNRFLCLSQRATRRMDGESEGSEDEVDGQIPVEAESESLNPSKMDFDSGLARSQEGDVSGNSSSVQHMSTALSPRQGRQRFAGLGDSNPAEFGDSDLYRNYLWGIPPNSSTDGTSAIPFILAGRDSFASRLYFETIVLIVRALRGDASSDVVDSAYRFKRRYVSLDRILGVTTGVLNMLLHGTSQDPNEQHRTVAIFDQAGALDERAMKAAIVEEVVSVGHTEAEYLNTWSVERYLGDKWGLIIDSSKVQRPLRALPEARQCSSSYGLNDTTRSRGFPASFGSRIQLAPTRIPGFLHSEQALLSAESLVEKITMGAVSLGDGPRWHVSYIDGAVEGFLRENNAWE